MASLFTNPLQRTACLLAAPPTAQSSTLKHALIRSPLRQISTSPSLRLIPKSSPKPELSQQPQASPLLSEEDDGPIHVHFNPYKTKKTWPPDFSKLSQRYQLRLERKYRRRMKLKFARPVWTKATILLQWGAAGFVLIYGVLFMDWGSLQGEEEPFGAIRSWWRENTASLWSSSDPDFKSLREPQKIASSPGSK